MRGTMIKNTEHYEHCGGGERKANARVSAKREAHRRILVVRERETNKVANHGVWHIRRANVGLDEPLAEEVNGIYYDECRPEYVGF